MSEGVGTSSRSIVVFCKCDGDHRDLHVLTHSFPTRRCADLAGVHGLGGGAAHLETLTDQAIRRREAIAASCDVLARIDVAAALADHAMSHNRSEEHTSELQSLMRISSSVFCLK